MRQKRLTDTRPYYRGPYAIRPYAIRPYRHKAIQTQGHTYIRPYTHKAIQTQGHMHIRPYRHKAICLIEADTRPYKYFQGNKEKENNLGEKSSFQSIVDKK